MHDYTFSLRTTRTKQDNRLIVLRCETNRRDRGNVTKMTNVSGGVFGRGKEATVSSEKNRIPASTFPVRGTRKSVEINHTLSR